MPEPGATSSAWAAAAMRSEATFTQPTVLTIQISLRVAARPSGRRYPSKVSAARGAGAGRGLATSAKRSSSSLSASELRRLCEWTCAPAATGADATPSACPYLTTGSPTPRSRRATLCPAAMGSMTVTPSNTAPGSAARKATATLSDGWMRRKRGADMAGGGQVRR